MVNFLAGIAVNRGPLGYSAWDTSFVDGYRVCLPIRGEGLHPLEQPTRGLVEMAHALAGTIFLSKRLGKRGRMGSCNGLVIKVAKW